MNNIKLVSTMTRAVIVLLGGFALLFSAGCATHYQMMKIDDKVKVINSRVDQTDVTVKQIAQNQVIQSQQIGGLISVVDGMSKATKVSLEANAKHLEELAAAMPARTLASGKVGVVGPNPSTTPVRSTVTLKPGDQSGPKFTLDQLRRGEVDLSTLTGVKANNYLLGSITPIVRDVNRPGYAFTDDGNMVQFWLDEKAVLPAGTAVPTELTITWK